MIGPDKTGGTGETAPVAPDIIDDGGPAAENYTVRDAFAGEAINGLFSALTEGANIDILTRDAYRIADSMMKARKA